MRYLCLDLGDKRTGLAIGDDSSGLVVPAGVVQAAVAPDDVAALRRVIEEHLGAGAGELVIGLPLNMDGSEGPRARRVRAIGAAVQAATGRVVHYADERLSTAAADWTMARSGLTHDQKKARRDALAAAAILRDFLAALPAPDTGSGPDA